MAVIGVHGLLYSSDADALRSMLRDVFGFPHVDAGGGWLVFRLPPAELGVHPVEGPTFDSGMRHELSFMCEGLHATMRELRDKGVRFRGTPEERSYGLVVGMDLPGGVEALLYEPRHATAIGLSLRSNLPAGAVLLTEALEGPAPGAANFLNAGDLGLLASLDVLTAEEASARPDGRSSVASHVDHLRYGLNLMNRWAAGEDPWDTADWAASWSRQAVTPDEWRELRRALAAEARGWLEVVRQPRAWDETGARNALSSVVHLAYHLGAIRQVAHRAAGPQAAPPVP